MEMGIEGNRVDFIGWLFIAPFISFCKSCGL